MIFNINNISLKMMPFLFVLFLFLFAGCATKITPLLEQDSMTSQISFRSSDDISLRNILVDSTNLDFLSSSFLVAEGHYVFSFDYLKGSQYCPPSEKCYPSIFIGSCKGKIKAEPSKAYLIEVKSKKKSIEVKFLPKGRYDFIERKNESVLGNATCESRRLK